MRRRTSAGNRARRSGDSISARPTPVPQASSVPRTVCGRLKAYTALAAPAARLARVVPPDGSSADAIGEVARAYECWPRRSLDTGPWTRSVLEGAGCSTSSKPSAKRRGEDDIFRKQPDCFSGAASMLKSGKTWTAPAVPLPTYLPTLLMGN